MMIEMNSTILSTPKTSAQTEAQEQQYRNSTSYIPQSITLFQDKVYDADLRDFVVDGGRVLAPKEHFLFDYGAIQSEGQSIIGASGKDITTKESVISSRYLSMVEDHDRIQSELQNAYSPYQVVGAAGSVTNFETVRRATDLVDVVGQEYTLEDYTALNVVTVRNVNKVRFTRPRKTSSLITVQREIGDDQEPEPERQTFTEGTVDIFADSVQYVKSMRDEIDTTFSPSAEFNKELAGMFAAEKDAKITEKINAVTGTNQGDWSAFSGGIFTTSAPDQVQVHEDAVKSYGKPLVALFADDAYKGYFRNIKEVSDASHAKSTSTDMGGVRLPGNPNVTAWANSSLTAGSYAVIAKPSYIDLFKAMTIQTSFKNVRTPGQAEHRFWFDFNGVLENTTSAIGKGTTVLA